VLAEALITKANVLIGRARPVEGHALLAHALQLAMDNGLWSSALRARNNLSFSLDNRDRHEEALAHLDQGQALAGKVGNRRWARALADSRSWSLYLLGRWEELMGVAAELFEPGLGEAWTSSTATSMAAVHAHRGQVAGIGPLLTAHAGLGTSADVQERAGYRAAEAIAHQAEGRHAEALAAGEEAVRALEVLGPGSEIVKQGFTEAAEAALALGDLAKAEALLAVVDRLRPGERPPYLDAQAARFRARLAATRDDPPGRAEAGFKAAAGLLRELQMPFWLAVTLLEHGEWLATRGRPAEAAPLLEEAGASFERLEARPWSERVARLAGRPAQARS
jgi:tetratricopeptide (TPR) repeat protein